MAKKEAAKETKAAAPVRHEPAEIPPLRPGDSVAVHVRIVEGDKERLQLFEGTVIQIRGAGANRSFTVRKVSRGYGIERIFPYATPAIAKVEVKRHGKARRAKLYYLRKRTGREAILQEQRGEVQPRPGTVAE
ncbi:50S ribosomal protein L19 [candidate division WOR-3 bacterium]|uniref:Large ribosomal subunit protein bL19 n=1 Tax=candidate division WOR-3 bacterium TaxID=2052148 RepID=A0A937XFQ2_UNCW3|nr:50S ribosomal protein L19 [candidate division WOR-3 bacterium]